MTIPKITPYSGGVANPDGSQTQTEFTQNMFDQLSYEAELSTELNNTVDGINDTATQVDADATSAAQSASAAEAAASGLNYQGLWPDTGGIAEKGDTYQTQVSGTPTGQYFTALQNTTVDPAGDNVNWREIISNKSITDAQGEVVGGLVFNGANEEFVSLGDTVPEQVSHLGILIESKVVICPLFSLSGESESVINEGAVTAINTTTAPYTITIGADLYYIRDARYKMKNGEVSALEFWPDVNGGAGASDAIQAALDVSLSVHIPSPKVFYRIDKTLYLRANQTIRSDNKWADWYLAADQARCLKGDDGIDVISTIKLPFSYPSNPPSPLEYRRGIQLIGLHAQSQGALCLKWDYATNFLWRDCVFRADASEAFIAHQSYRGKIENSLWTSGNFAGYSGKLYDNCNGITITGPSQTPNSTIGGTLDISKSQSVNYQGAISEISGIPSVRVAGLTTTEAAHVEEVGNCHDITIKGYFEECYEVAEVGTASVCFGFNFKGFSSNYGNYTTQRACFTLGAVAGWSIESSSFIKETPTTPTIIFAQLSGSPFRVATKGSWKNNHAQINGDSQNVGIPFAFDVSYPKSLSGYTFGSSYMDFTGNADIAGGIPVDFKVYGERLVVTQEFDSSVSSIFMYGETDTGGLVEKIEIFGSSGVVDSTLRIGSSTSSASNLLLDLSGVSLSNGYFNATPNSQLLRPDSQLVMQNVAGSGSGKYSVRITLRK